MSAPRRWARRAVLSMLAGGGLSAAGFGGPLVGGALGAEAQTGTTTPENTSPAVTETTPQAPTSTQGAGAATGGGGETGAGSTTSSTPSTSATTPAPTDTTPPPTTPPAAATAPSDSRQPPTDGGAAPTVVVQSSQQTTAGVRGGANTTGHGKGTTGAKRGGADKGGGAKNEKGEGAAQGPKAAEGPNGVAPAPQTAGEEVGALAALLSGSTVSAQALEFYRIPLFLLPVYQAAAFQYDVPWQILAAINEVETDYGTDLSVSTAGAIGWMQFMPGTWLQYGVDATDAGYADPYNPVDAVFAAARYLHAAGAARDLRDAIYAYNHSQEYVESVLLRARLIASYPRPVIATLTGLADGRAPTPGAHLAPGAIAELAARAAAAQAGESGGEGESSTGPADGAAGEGASPAGEGAAATSTATAGAVPLAPTPSTAAAQALHGGNGVASASAGVDGTAGADGTTGAGGAAGHNAAGSTATPGSTPAPPPQAAAARARAAADAPAKPSQLVDVLGDPGAAVVAVQDGRIERLGRSRALGRYLVLRDIYGDIFTYAGLGSIAPRFRPSVPGVRASALSSGGEPTRDPTPTQPASAGHQRPLTLKVKTPAPVSAPAATPLESESDNVPAGMGRVRLFAHPGNPVARAASRRVAPAPASAGGWQPLRVGSIVAKGTALGHLDTPPGTSAGRLRFAVRPAGDGGTIDPQTLLQSWRQLEVALHPKGSKNGNSLLGATAGDALTMGKGELERAVLADAGIQLDACARHDVAAGAVDKRVLAVLVFLSRSGLQPTVAAVRCPRRGVPAGVRAVGRGSAASTAGLAATPVGAQDGPAGPAVDIAAINNVPLAGHQGAGTVADATIRALLTLHGQFAPRTIASLMSYPWAPATQAHAAAWNRIGIEFAPPHAAVRAHAASAGPTAASPLALTGEISEAQWSKLIGRIAALPKPALSAAPSSAAIRDPQAAPTNRGLGARGLGAGG